MEEECVETLIVGAGFAGLCMAIKLLEAGRRSFLLVEKSADLGGTWRDNRYPSCACDVPSHLYAFSFYPNPTWSRAFAPRGEIHSYLHSCAAHYGLFPTYIRFHTQADTATWDATTATWTVQLSSTLQPHSATYLHNVHANFLVNATGAFNVQALPSVPGVKSFNGVSFHTSEWWLPLTDLNGKTVAVIGTGASAIQIVPEIATMASKLYVCQRTPAWILPKPDFAVSTFWKWTFANIPLVLRLWRSLLFCFMELLGYGYYGTATLITGVMRRLAKKAAVKHMENQIQDPVLRSKLRPSYEIGCKRVLLSNDFYPALARPNVELITGTLTEVRQGSVIFNGGDMELDVDVIVYATGFDLQQPKLRVVGTNKDVSLSEDVTRPAYLGMTWHGYPNYFAILGENTGLGHSSVLLMIEAQVGYILSCMKLLEKSNCSNGNNDRHGKGKTKYNCIHDHRAIQVKSSSHQWFLRFMASRYPATVWRHGGCRSYYVHPESGQNTVIWPASVVEYLWHTRSASASDYEFL